jgi:hypothetical protein
MLDPITTVAVVKVVEKASKSISDGLIGKLKTKIEAVTGDKVSDIYHKLFNSFKTYIENSQTRYSYFLTLAIPNEKLLLEDFYLPLTLVKKSSVKNEEVISDFPVKLVEKYKDILVVDTAGMGKSTLLKFLFINATQFDNKIPIFIELRHLSTSKKILDHIFDELKSIDKDLDKALVGRLLNSGEFIILLDGYDEVEEAHLEAVTNDILTFKQKANANNFILSSRDQAGLTSFSDFQRFTIKPLAIEEAYSLLIKYSRGDAIGDELITKLKLPENTSVYEFLQNPLLVSLLFKAYEYTPEIPLKKHLFYSQVYDALFKRHDLSKGAFSRNKKSGLDSYFFLKAISALGFKTMQIGKVEYHKNDIFRYIQESQEYIPNIIYKPALFLEDLTHAVPFLTEEGSNIRWNHKSLQEYFAAVHLLYSSDKHKKSVLEMMSKSVNSSSYINFLALYSDLDANSFKRYFIGSLLKIIQNEIDRINVEHLGELSELPELLREKYQRSAFFMKIGIVKYDVKKPLLTRDAINNKKGETHMIASAKFKEVDANFSGFSAGHPINSSLGNLVNFQNNLSTLLLLLYNQNLLPKHIFSMNNKKEKLDLAFESLINDLDEGVYVNENYENNTLYQENVFNKFVELVSMLSPFIFDMKAAQLEIEQINAELKKEEDLEFNF